MHAEVPVRSGPISDPNRQSLSETFEAHIHVSSNRQSLSETSETDIHVSSKQDILINQL
jgi:hypothetical protein